jgi:diguanylate cyclase (GGDEF)-like protein
MDMKVNIGNKGNNGANTLLKTYRNTSISTKLVLATLAIAIPFGIFSWLVDSQIRENISLAGTELAGTSHLRDAYIVQSALGKSWVRTLAGSLPTARLASLELGAADPDKELSSALERLTATVAEPDQSLTARLPDQSAPPMQCGGIADMRAAWNWYKATQRQDAFEHAAEVAGELIDRLATCSSLAIDPALRSQMLARISVSTLPESDLAMTRLQQAALAVMADKPIGDTRPSHRRDALLAEAARFRLGLLRRLILESRTAAAPDSAASYADQALTLTYGQRLVSYQETAERLLEATERTLKGYAAEAELFNAASRLRRAGFQLFDAGMDELDAIIVKRMETYRNQRLATLALGLAGMLAAVFFMSMAARSINRAVAAVVDYTRRVTSGDLDAVADSSDLGPRMRSMVADTDSMVSELKNKIGYLNGILHGMTVPCFVVNRDEQLTFINQPYLDLYERKETPEECIGLDLATFFYNDPNHETVTGRCMRLGAPISNEMHDTRTQTGKILHVRLDVAPLHDLDTQLIGAFAVVSDLTVIMEKEKAIERLAAFPREAPSPVLSAAADGSILYMNNAATEVFDTSGMAPDQNFLPEGHPELVATCLGTGTSRHGIESRVSSHHYSWTYHPLVDQGTVHMYASDITKRVRAEEQLLHNAFHDALTGLPNKALFLDRVKQTLRRAQRRDMSFAVLFLDLDGFRNINDGLGHGLGDKLLARFAWRIKKLLGQDETLARMGGDEFTVLLPATNDAEHATQVANRIQGELKRPFEVEGHDLFISVSIGIINAPEATAEAEDLLRDAETAMYHAKAMGRGRSQQFDPSMHVDATERISLENDLKKSMEHNEFEPYYQPIVSLTSGRIAGFEALVRWNHPEQGVVSPARFIPIAEETGLIVPMGAMMLETAFKQTRIWQEMFEDFRDLSISVNMSVVQITRPTMGGEIRNILSRAGIPPSSVKIEVTESGLMNNVGSASDLLTDLKAMGVSLMIDDFGTGYSSLSHLHQFPFHFIKIDQSFISTMEDTPDNMEIVRTIISLAHALGKQVVAEGVETSTQKDLLANLGCEFFQGYYFSPPVPAHKAEALLAKAPRW